MSTTKQVRFNLDQQLPAMGLTTTDQVEFAKIPEPAKQM